MAKDPVCGMQVDESNAAGHADHGESAITSARRAVRRSSSRTLVRTLESPEP